MRGKENMLHPLAHISAWRSTETRSLERNAKIPCKLLAWLRRLPIAASETRNEVKIDDDNISNGA